jgi:hypothetical protein
MSIGIRDANEVNLLAASGIALTAANSGDLGAPTLLEADATDVTFVLTLNTSGTTLASIDIQVASNADFDEGVRTIGSFGPIDAATADGEVRYLDATVPGYPLPGRYVAAFVTTGASAVLTGSTLYARVKGYGLNSPTRSSAEPAA